MKKLGAATLAALALLAFAGAGQVGLALVSGVVGAVALAVE